MGRLDKVLVMEVVGFYKNKTSFNIYKLNIFTCMGRRCRSLVLQCYNSSISTYPVSEEQLKAFIAKVQEDISLQEQLKAKGADVVAIAKAAGLSITTEDLNSHRQNLSDDELEGLAGGGCLCFSWGPSNPVQSHRGNGLCVQSTAGSMGCSWAESHQK